MRNSPDRLATNTQENSFGSASTALANSCAALLAVLSVFAVYHARDWHLFGDQGIFHYVVFAMHAGQLPYKQIVDFNFPGTYGAAFIVQHLSSDPNTAERIYDASLCLLALLGYRLCLASVRTPNAAAVIAASLFTLIHLQDGLVEAGQRDYLMAVLALLGCGVLVSAPRKRALNYWLFGFTVGVIFTIKPTLVLLLAVPAAPFLFRERWSATTARSRWLAVSVGFLIAPAITFLWLVKHHALFAFLRIVESLGAIHASLAHRSLPYLALHSVSPIGPFLVLWLISRVVSRRQVRAVEAILVLAALVGLLSYISQFKGLSYQRYPFLALCIAVLTYQFLEVNPLTGFHSVSRWVVYVALLGQSAVMIYKIEHCGADSEFRKALNYALSQQKTHANSSVQCFDTYQGCLDVLYERHILQPTDFLYDCYAFAASRDRNAYRNEMITAVKRAKPQTIILTSGGCFNSSSGFSRFDTWPELRSLLIDNYKLSAEWQPSHSERVSGMQQLPASFEVYSIK